MNTKEYLENLIKRKKLNNIFLKIDIVGSEYRVLDEIIKNKNKNQHPRACA